MPKLKTLGISRQTRRIASLCVVGLFLVGFLILVLLNSEPRYQGRSLTQWLEQAQAANLAGDAPEHPETEPDWRESQIAIRAMGKQGQRFLMEWIQAKDSETKLKAIQWFNDHPVLHVNMHPFPAMRKHVLATHGFSLLGQDAVPLHPVLIEMTKNPDRDARFWGYCAFASTRPDKGMFIPVAASLLKDPDTEIRNMAAESLYWRFPKEAKEVGLCELFPAICYPTNSPIHLH